MKRRTRLLSLGASARLVLAFGLALGLALGLVLRETGAVELSAYELECQATCRTNWHADSDPKQRGGESHVRMRDHATGVISVNGEGPDGPFQCTTRLTQFEIDGLCWVPLRKSATASFAAELRTQDQRLVAEFDGELSRTVTGPCSLHEFRSRLRDQALDQIERAIDDHF
ncbi:MAG: hypothetical protein L6Q99_02000 [Planctomycetes bacterium]|nr:hypothetical protein [Planctomycetota bacterium]